MVPFPDKQVRKSGDYRPAHNSTELVRRFEQRTADLSRLPHDHSEELQILQYKPGGFYHVHDDASNMEFYAHQDATMVEKHYGLFDRMLTLYW